MVSKYHLLLKPYALNLTPFHKLLPSKKADVAIFTALKHLIAHESNEQIK